VQGQAPPSANGTAQATDLKAKIAAYQAALQRAQDAHMHVLNRMRPNPQILPDSRFRAWDVMELSEPGRFVVFRVQLEQQPDQEDHYKVYQLVCECEEGERDGMCPHIALVTEDFRDQRDVLLKVGAV
jgi:hypothetical protein